MFIDNERRFEMSFLGTFRGFVACLFLLVLGVLGCAIALAHTAHAASASGRCTTVRTVIWLDTQGDAGAGSVFYSLKFTNLLDRPCTLTGFPGVSAVDLAGHQLGRAGARTPSTVATVSLASGATVSAALRIVQVVNFPTAACKPVNAAGLRVYPPGQTAAKVVPFPFKACSRSGPVYLNVKAVS
jgi:hypothetical protein